MRKQKYAAKVLALCVALITFSDYSAVTHFRIRSQSYDSARELAGWEHEINLYRPNECDPYGSFTTTFEYTRSFRADKLARCLFGPACLSDECGCDGDAIINISGSQVDNRGDSDWLADYFYLPTDFKSSVAVKPRIKNFIVDFNYYKALDNWCEGAYFRVHAPAVHTKWRLGFEETVEDVGTNGYADGYFTDAMLPRSALLNNFTEYATGERALDAFRGVLLNASIPSDQVEENTNNAVRVETLKCAKWSDDCCKPLNETRLSDIETALGWNFWQCDDYHAGLNIRASFPTGNRPNGEYFFEPIVGNGHHWALGAGWTSHYTFWHGCDDDRSLGLYVDANVLHLFKDRQCLNFDLKNGCNSRYELAICLDTPVEDLYSSATAGNATDATQPSAQFKNLISPVANLTKSLVDVSIGVQVDATAMLSYVSQCGNFGFDLGYNAFYNSCSKIELVNCNTKCPNKLSQCKWALKGDSYVFGYTQELGGCTASCPSIPDNQMLLGQVVPLSPSQHCATIHEGQNGTTQTSRNPGVDNAQFAQTQASNTGSIILNQFNPNGALQTRTSNDPVILTNADLDICSAQTKLFSNKVFAAVNYNWDGNECWCPFISVAAKAEFGRTSSSKSDCNTSCLSPSIADCDNNRFIGSSESCRFCTLSEWGVWFKGGISFN